MGLKGRMLGLPVDAIAPGTVTPPTMPMQTPPMQFPGLQGRIGNIQGMLSSGLNKAGNPLGRPDFWQNRLNMLQGRLSDRMGVKPGLPPGIEIPHIA